MVPPTEVAVQQWTLRSVGRGNALKGPTADQRTPSAAYPEPTLVLIKANIICPHPDLELCLVISEVHYSVNPSFMS